jgi:3-hydroxyisobutyrate dehydrogenase-like beta-hydroxyacid dehydrogenase
MPSANDRPGLGCIGAGRVGLQLAARLLDAGHDVAVYNRTRAKAEPLAERGATLIDRSVELADRDVVFSKVSASAVVEVVITGPDGVLTAPHTAPGILIYRSTVSAQVSALVSVAAAKRDTSFLAAPDLHRSVVVTGAAFARQAARDRSAGA